MFFSNPIYNLVKDCPDKSCNEHHTETFKNFERVPLATVASICAVTWPMVQVFL